MNMQQESENLQQKNLSFGEQPNFKALVNERKSIQQNQFQNDFGNNQNQYRHSNLTNQNHEQAYDNQHIQGNYNFGALRSTNQSNNLDLKKIQEFMDLNHTGGHKSLGGNGSGSRRSNTSFADEVQKEIQDFNALKNSNNRNRTGSNQSRNSNSENMKIRQSAGVKTNNMDYQKKDPIGSEVKIAGRRSDDRFSDKMSFFLKNVRDDENSVSSLSKRQKENHQDSFMGGQNVQYYPPFIDDKLSNINDTMMSNAKMGHQGNSNQVPKTNIQVINAIANVFDNIDILNPNKEAVIQQLNDSQINSKFLAADHNDEFENQKSLSPQRESFKVSIQNEKLNLREKQKENGLQMNDETGSFAKDGYINFGERNSIHDNHQVNDQLNHHDLNVQNVKFQQNDSSKADPFMQENEFQNFQRQTFNPNDQNLINPTPNLKIENPIQEYQEKERKINEENQIQRRDDFKAEVIKQDKNTLSKAEREKQIELMMDQLMASRQNFAKNQPVSQQQIKNQFNINPQKLQNQIYTKSEEPQTVQQDLIQQQQVKHDRFQDQFKIWQQQKNQNQSSHKPQNNEGSNNRSSSKVSDQISSQLNQNWETLASQIQIPVNKEQIQKKPKIQEYHQQIPQEQISKKEYQNENTVQIEIKSIRVEQRPNDRSIGRQQSFIREDSYTHAQVPNVYVQPSNQASFISQQQLPTNHSQYVDTQQSFYSSNPNQIQQMFSPLKQAHDQTNHSEFGATRGRNDQARQQSRSGSRMSQAGRNQRYADGRQSRSGSKSSLANQEDQSSLIQSLSLQNKPISNSNTLHVQKNLNFNNQLNQDTFNHSNTQYQNLNQRPVAGSNRQQMIEINNVQINQLHQPASHYPQSNITSFRSQASDWSLDQTMELKRKQMAEDQAKALQAQQQLENLAKKRRAEEQQKLLEDLKSSKLFQQTQRPIPEQNLRETKASPQRFLKQEPRKISVTRYHDDEFNDIDESTDKGEANSAIRVSGPQNHRRYDEFQGPLHQRNQNQKFDPTINHDLNRNKNSLKVQNTPYNENIRRINQASMKIQSQSESSQQPFGTIISSSQQKTNDQYSITLMNNVEHSHQNFSDNKTQAISGYPISNQYQNPNSSYQRNNDPTKTKSQLLEKENQVKNNYQEFSRVNPQTQKTSDSKIENSERRNSASRFFQALSQKRSESRGNGRRNSRSGALQEVINRSNSRGDRFRFFGKKEGEPQSQETENQQQIQNSQTNSFSLPTQKEVILQSNQQFQYEFQSILKKHLQSSKTRNPHIYIAELLKDLGFLNQLNQFNMHDNRLQIMLEQQKDNLILVQNGQNGQAKYFNENLDNLFKVLCCILGLEQESKQSAKLEQSLLDTLLNRIDIEKEDKDVLVLEQLVMIKIMVSRQSFSLAPLQAQQIQSKFYNLALNRNNYSKSQGQFVKQDIQNQRVLSPRIHSGIRQQEQTNKPLHPPVQQTNQRQWQGNRPQSRAGSSARQNSNTQVQQSNQQYKPAQTLPSRYQDASQNQNLQSNISDTHQKQEYRQLNQVQISRNNQQVQSRSPYRQQNEGNLNFQNQNRLNAYQNIQGNNVKLNQVRPANSSQFCPSEPETIRDSFNPRESESYIGARETQRFNEFQKVATPTPLLQNAQSNQFTQGINQVRNFAQSKSPLRDNGHIQEKQQQLMQQKSDNGNSGNALNRNQIQNSNQQSQQTNSNIDNGQSNINMLNDSFGPIHHTKTESHEQNIQLQKLQNMQKQPICVLKIELDGSHVEEIQVFDGEDPKIVVQRFAQMFNLSDEAVQKLTLQIQQQIQIYNRNKVQKI